MLRDVSQAENEIVDAGSDDNLHNLEVRRQESEFRIRTRDMRSEIE